jgi:hypothetical protein
MPRLWSGVLGLAALAAVLAVTSLLANHALTGVRSRLAVGSGFVWFDYSFASALTQTGDSRAC